MIRHRSSFHRYKSCKRGELHGLFRRISRYRIELQWKISHLPSQPAVVLGPRSMLSRDRIMPIDTWNFSETQGNVFGNPWSMFDSTHRPWEGFQLYESKCHRIDSSASKHRATFRERFFTIWEHNTNADACNKAVNHEFSLTSGSSTEFICCKAKTGKKIQKPGDRRGQRGVEKEDKENSINGKEKDSVREDKVKFLAR